MPNQSYSRGLSAAILAFAIWGFFPIYWKLLSPISSIELLYTRLILTHRQYFTLIPKNLNLAYRLSYQAKLAGRNQVCAE